MLRCVDETGSALVTTLRQRLRKKERFLQAFRRSGVITHACEQSGVARPTVYRWLEKDEKFSIAFGIAVQESTEYLEQVAIKRAEEGSDQLLMFLLRAKNPERYRDRADIRVTDAREEANRIAAENGLDAEALLAEAERLANTHKQRA